jgi:hypothetical protein
MAEWWEADPTASTIDVASDAVGASPQVADIARSIYHQESNSGKNTKTSNAGAVGGMQILPDTFKEVADKGWDINNPLDNAKAGVRYLQKLYEKAGGDPKLTAVGYYGGPGAIDKAKQGIAVSDPRNPNAPNTLQYGDQVASRLQGGGGDNWWSNDPVASTPTQGSQDPVADPNAQPQSEGGHAWGNIINGVGQAVFHPIDTVEKIGGALVDGAKDIGNRYMNDPLGTMNDAVRGVADAATFGYADKAAAALQSGHISGDEYDAALAAERAKDAAGGSAFTAGQLGSVLLPGGVGSLAGKAVEAVPVASRLAKVAVGTGAGAAEGVAQYAGHNDGAFNASDASAYGALGALGGAGLGATSKHTGDQMAESFLRKAGGDVEGAKQSAEITQGLQGLSQRAAQNGVALGPADANALASKYTSDAANLIRQLPKDQNRQTLLNALNTSRGLNDTDIAALRQLPNGDAVADAIQMRQRAQAMTAAKPANANGVLSTLRMGVDNGLLGAVGTAMGHPAIGVALNSNAVRGTVNRLLGGRENRTGNIASWLKQGDNADAFLNKYGASTPTQSASALSGNVQQTLAAQQAAQQAAVQQAQATAQAKAAAQIGPQITNAQWVANQQKAAAQVGPQISPQQLAVQRAAQLQQAQAAQARAAQMAQNVSANQAAGARIQAAQAARANGAPTVDLAEQARQAQMAQNIRANQAAGARLQAEQAARANAVPQAQAQAVQAAQARQAALAQAQAANAQAGQAATARIQANLVAERQATQVAAQAQARANQVQQVANGNFDGLNIENPRMQLMLDHVDHPGHEAVKEALTHLAKTDPDKAAVAVHLMDSTSRGQQNWYPLQEALQSKFGKKTPSGPSGASAGPSGALSGVNNPQAYAAGIANRQKYAADTFASAPAGPVKELVGKLGTISDPEVRKMLFDAVHDKVSGAEKDFMDKKVAHMIDYGKK